MDFFDKLFELENNDENAKEIEKISRFIDINIESTKHAFKLCDDVVFREFKVGKDQSIRFLSVCIEGLSNSDYISDYILQNLMVFDRMAEPSIEKIRNKLFDITKDGSITVMSLKEVTEMESVKENILVGNTIVFIDGYDKAIMIETKGWPQRSISEPETDAVVRGSREGFTETLRVNTALIRRRVRDTRLKIKQLKIGERSNTDVAIVFMEDIVNRDILETVVYRLNEIDIDAILESGYIEQLIEDNYRSPFPQIQNAERPEKIVAGLYEGRVAVVVDNTPFVLIIPTTLNTLLQASEDYNNRFVFASFIRLIRHIAVFISVTLPSIYIALLSFHPGMIPTQLALYIAGNRDGVPFPAVIEGLLMALALELLREAGIHLPGAIGATIGIVGGLVLGQAAVEAGIVSSLMVVVIAMTAIANYSIPNYSFGITFRLLRFLFMILAAIFGLYGVILGMLTTLIHLGNLKSFGVPYLSPYSYISTIKDLKDTFIRVPLFRMKKRPGFINKSDGDRISTNLSRSQYTKREDS